MFGAPRPPGAPEEPRLDAPPNEIAPPAGRMPWLLVAGAALGLAVSAAGLLEQRAARHVLTDDIAAIVGDRPIRRIDYERMLAGVEQDRRGPIDDGTRRRVLERMIDEELLVQQALALGLAQIDRRVRGELVSSIVDSVVSEVDAEPPSEAEIEQHYRANAAFFARPGRLRVESLFFSERPAAATAGERGGNGQNGVDAAQERARAARARLARGEDFAAVAADLADRAVLEIPDALLPLAKLRDYVGPAAIETLAALAPGDWSGPLETAGGFRLIRLVEREPETTPPLAEVADLVRDDLVRRRGDEALRRHLDALREEIDVVRNADLFAERRAATGGEPNVSQ